MTLELATITSISSTPSNRVAPPVSSGIRENLDFILVALHPNLLPGKLAQMRPEAFSYTQVPEEVPVMTSPPRGAMAYEALKEELKNAMNTLMGGCCVEEEPMFVVGRGGDAEWEEEEWDGDECDGGATLDISCEMEGIEDPAWLLLTRW